MKAGEPQSLHTQVNIPSQSLTAFPYGHNFSIPVGLAPCRRGNHWFVPYITAIKILDLTLMQFDDHDGETLGGNFAATYTLCDVTVYNRGPSTNWPEWPSNNQPLGNGGKIWMDGDAKNWPTQLEEAPSPVELNIKRRYETNSVCIPIRNKLYFNVEYVNAPADSISGIEPPYGVVSLDLSYVWRKLDIYEFAALKNQQGN